MTGSDHHSWRARPGSSAAIQQRQALLLNKEVAAVEAGLRCFAPWAVVQRSYYDEDRNEPGKYDDTFRSLRAEIFKNTDWSKADPMAYLAPFLTLIKASDVSGPVTGAAAVAIQTILDHEFISLSLPTAGAAINQIVEDASLCKFQSTNNAQDEIVLFNILQIFASALNCEAGVLLTDDTIYKAFHAAYMLGSPIAKEYSDFMVYSGRQFTTRMVQTVFTHLRQQASGDSSEPIRLCQHGVKSAADIMEFLIELLRKQDPEQQAREHLDREQQEDTIMFALNMIHTALVTLGHEMMHFPSLVELVHVELLHALCQTVINLTSVSAINSFTQIILCIYTFIGTISICQIEVVLDRVLLRLAEGKGVAQTEQQEAALEGVLDLCRQPGFVHDIFVNCDCRLERGNLFEDLCNLVCKTAYPGGQSKGSVSHLHVIAQEVLLSILRAIAAENKSNAFQPPPPDLELPCFMDVWTPLVHGDIMHLQPLMDAADAAAAAAGAASGGAASLPRAVSAPGVAVPPAVEASVANGSPRHDGGSGIVSAAAAVTPTSASNAGAACLASATAAPAMAATAAARAVSAELASPGGIESAADHVEAERRRWALDPAAAAAAPVAPAPSPTPASATGTGTSGGAPWSSSPGSGDPAAAAAAGVEAASAGAVVTSEEAAAGLGPAPAVHPAHQGSLAPLSDVCRLRSAVYEKHLKTKLKVAVEHFNKDHKKGLQFLQSVKLMPLLQGSPAAQAALESGSCLPQDIVSEEELAACLGRFLRVCPNLDKVSIGELLGEPADFYIKVLEAYTQSFDFRDLQFDAGIRLYLESFRLPGEAQKINRIINAFGHHYFNQNRNVFRSADAAYVLAYSVIMLNTDRHNSQVKNKMSLESFRRNLRGVNDNTDFPVEFLDAIYYSIIKDALKLNESDSMDVSSQVFLNLHQISCTPRGQMIHSDPGRHLFDTTMFRLMWGPAVNAMCSIVDNVVHEPMLDAALSGLQAAAHIAVCHQLEDVADSIVVNLSKIPNQILNVTGARPDVVFGRDVKMRKVTRTIAALANKHGDCLQSGWTNVVDLIISFYRLQMVPESFGKALDGDGEGGLHTKPGEAPPSLKTRRMMAKAQSSGGISILRSLTSILALPGQEPDYPERQMTDMDRQMAAVADETLRGCAFEDIFTDSKFLKHDSLVHLVRAIIVASGPIPRPSANGPANWDVAELCLELLFTVLLRNRDRIAALWPRTYEHFHAIFSCSRDVDAVLVQKAIMAMMRLCQRLLPYKTDISEPLLRGIQLVSLVDEQVASDMAATIAAEVLNLLKGAAPYIQHQPVWVSICGLLKIIQYDPASFPVCVETMTWVVKESLTPLNFTIVLPTVVDLLERAVPDMRRGGERQGYPQFIPDLLSLLLSAEEWLELWWSGMSRSPRASEPQWRAFKHDAWYQVVSMLCRVIKNPNLEVRSTAVGYLQRSVVAAEKLGIAVEQVQESLMKLVLPMANDLGRTVAAGSRDFAQCDVTQRELIRAVVKAVLLYAEPLQELPTFGTTWQAILDCLGGAMAGGAAKSELLAEAIPEALKNMLLVLGSKRNLNQQWLDTDGTDLTELTWKVAKKISPMLTPQLLANPAAAASAVAAPALPS